MNEDIENEKKRKEEEEKIKEEEEQKNTQNDSHMHDPSEGKVKTIAIDYLFKKKVSNMLTK